MNKSLVKSFWYETLDSTMNEANRLVKSGKIQDIAYIAANEQTAGRGTRGRSWSSPSGAGIYLSVVHLPRKGKYFPKTTLYTPGCGIACTQALKEVCNIDACIKPINDIYVNGKKLGGILVESKLYKEGISVLITGIGINISKVSRKLDNLTTETISIEEILPAHDFKNFSKKLLTENIVNKVCLSYSRIFKGEV